MEVFDKEELVFADSNKITGFDIDPMIIKFSSIIGLPNILPLLNMRFFMDFTQASEDKYIREKFNTDGLYVFGMKVLSPFMFTEYKLEDIGIDRKYNFEDLSKLIKTLTDIEKKRKIYIMDELAYAGRICLDTKGNNRIINLDTFGNEVIFYNSSIEQLALSMSAFCSSQSSQNFVTAMNQIDPQAIESTDHFWPSAADILEDFFYYMDDNSIN